VVVGSYDRPSEQRLRRALRTKLTLPLGRPSGTEREVSQPLVTFLRSNVDGEAVEQKDDDCFGVVRCQHGLRFRAQSDNP
jgi:hypothetical protein